VPQRLPRFYAYLQKIEDEKRLAEIILESGGEETEAPKLTRSADGHDPSRLRGLPAVGRNVTGAIRGTDPLRALIQQENGRRR
jgi:hypothetical protein